ncbi:MAG: hypothetical protein JW937_03755 [Candidatus Omnitrophica bacterium]|nr:hypothetical protein [Candidatus Omnitrophota bacterium]
MNSYLPVLVAIQAVDKDIYRIQADLSKQPARLSRLDAQGQRLKDELQAAGEERKQLLLQQKEQELRLGEQEQAIQKYQAQLVQVKTNREYSSLKTEIENHKADGSLIEEEIIRTMEKVEAAESRLQAAQIRHDEDQQKLAEERKAIETQSAEIKSKLESLHAQRDELLPKCDKKALAVYERILRSKGGTAVVPVSGGSSCGFCFMGIPPQLINDISLTDRLVECGSCGCILYLQDALSEVSPDAASQ